MTLTFVGIEAEWWDKVLSVFDSLVTDLERYENQFGMDSEEFYDTFQHGEIEGDQDELYSWRTKYSAYQHMSRRFGLVRL